MKRRRPNRRALPASHPQAAIISGLNVLQVLDDLAPRYFKTVLHYGAAAYADPDRASVVVWFRRKGLREYRNLRLFGLWASAQDGQTQLIIGTKTLIFSAPVFNPESYMQLIRNDYRIYYQDDGTPPTAKAITAQFAYDPQARLTLRQAVADALRDWFTQYAP